MINLRLGKALAVAVIILFLGLAIQPSVAVQPETEIDIEPKDYLFQTIIDIANNPELKELLEQHKCDLFKLNVDRSVYCKLFLRYPRLFGSLLFSKSSLTYEYLDRTYSNGIEITKIIGEDKALELIESIEVTDTEVLDEFNSIISKDEELSIRFETLKQMNNESNSILGYPYPIICTILTFLAMPSEILFDLINIFQDFYFISYFIAFIWAILIPYWIVILYLAFGFGCFF